MCQEDAPIRRLKWGTASLIARAPCTPIVLPIVHHGFEKVILLSNSYFALRSVKNPQIWQAYKDS